MTRRRWFERGLLVLVAVEVAFGVVAAVVGVLAPEISFWSRLPVFVAYAISFLGVGLFLASIAGDNRGARALAMVLALSATPFADAILSWTSPYVAIAAWGSFWSHLRLDALLPYFVWCFAATFPDALRLGAPRSFARVGAAASLAVGAALIVLHLLVWLEQLSPSLDLSALQPVLRGTRAGLYWPALFLCLLPALGLLAWQAAHSRSRQRRRVVWFVVALVAGVLPMLVMTFGESFSKSFARLFENPRTATPLLVIYDLGLLSIPFTTAFAVIVHRVFDLRFVLRKVVQYMLARVTLVVLSVLPLVLLGVFLVRQSHLPLSTLFAGPRGVGLLSWSCVGLLCLPQRRRWLQWLDRRFFREQYDAQHVLTGLVQKCERASSPEELGHLLRAEIDAALHVERIELLVYRPELHCYASLDRDGPVLAKESMLVSLASAAGGPVPIDVEAPTRVPDRMSESERHWLSDHSFELLIPVSGADGQLLALLGLGSKISELPFSRDDIRLLKAIARSAGLVLENQLLRVSRLWSSDPSPEPASPDERSPIPADWAGEPPALLCDSCLGVALPDAKGACERCGGALARIALPRIIHGKYRLTGWIGRGGMGVVYRAEDLVLGRSVALKTLPSTSLDKAARLRREARAVARVSHPNLALIYGAETWRGQPLLVFELLEGGTLRDRLRSGPMHLEEALELALPLCDALRYLHGEGVLHLDIKPSNIGFDRAGVPKLLDFGVARLAPQVDSSEAPKQGDVASDEAGSRLAGTPLYMSPEVLRGKTPDFAADLWSLCVVFYETVLGVHPFLQEGSAQATVLQIVNGTYARISGIDERLAVPLDRFFARAFALSPRRRPRRAGELRAMLLELGEATRAERAWAAAPGVRAARKLVSPRGAPQALHGGTEELPTETSDRH